MSPFVVFVVLFLSLHACDARLLGSISHVDVTRSKDMKKVDSYALQDGSKTHENSLGATNQENGLGFPNEKQVVFTKGNEHLIVSTQNNFPQKIKIKDMKSEGRSMVESAVESKQNDVTEDVDVMDYAQPHRKPPIHNEKS